MINDNGVYSPSYSRYVEFSTRGYPGRRETVGVGNDRGLYTVGFFDAALEFEPALESVLACNNELSVAQTDALFSVGKSRLAGTESPTSVGVVGAMYQEQLFGLVVKTLQAGAGGSCLAMTTLSLLAWGE